MKIYIKIDLGNAEMQTTEHVAHVLRRLAIRLEDQGNIPPGDKSVFRDVNGNIVGVYEVKE